MKIIKSILGIIGVMLFLMGIIYGDNSGIYLSSAAIFLIIYAFNIIKWLEGKIKIEINFPSEIFLIGSLAFVYLSFYEINITIYNIVMATCCTLLSWLFIFYLNVPVNRLNIEENIKIKKDKYPNYKNPSKTLLNKSKVNYKKEEYQKQIDELFKIFKLKIKYIEDIQNSWLLTYKYEIATGIKIDDILELLPDLELKLQTKVEIVISETESNMIYIKIPRKEISSYRLINCLEENDKNLVIPLGEDDDGNKVNVDLEENSPIILLGEVGTGKTNLLNVIINSILLNYTPQELNLILIDKRQTGLDVYNNIPHLALPLLNNPSKVLEYLDSINLEIERRMNEQEENTPLIVIIDEIFDIEAESEEIKEKLEQLILLGKKVGIYLIISTSTMNKTPLMDYLYTSINTKIYFYGRNTQEYNSYQNTITSEKGLINIKVDNQEKRIRTPKIDSQEIKDIVDNAKGLK